MDALVIASYQADARAAQAIERHHDQLAATLALKVESLTALARADWTIDDGVRADLVDWCSTELVPHALAEETTLYRAVAQRPEGRLLVEAMLAEHQLLIGLVERFRTAPDSVTAAVAAGALLVVFESHLAKENEQVIPLLVGAPDVSVAGLLDGVHELLGAAQGGHEDEGESGCGGSCTCTEEDDADLPELDARVIPHAIRHATIFGALDAVEPGRGLVLVAPHDPLPMLAQLEKRSPGEFTAYYLEQGPEAWRLSLMRADKVRADG